MPLPRSGRGMMTDHRTRWVAHAGERPPPLGEGFFRSSLFQTRVSRILSNLGEGYMTVTDPPAEHLCNCWVIRGPDNRKVTSGIYRTADAFELRASYSNNEILRTQLFPRTPDVIE